MHFYYCSFVKMKMMKMNEWIIDHLHLKLDAFIILMHCKTFEGRRLVIDMKNLLKIHLKIHFITSETSKMKMKMKIQVIFEPMG